MAVMSELRIESWQDAQSILFEGSWVPTIYRFRSPYAFRGVSKATYRLETTLVRLGASDPEWVPEMEKHLLRNFRKYAYRNAVERDSLWHWLALAQHHGLATRMLDWTYSPNVALHFATESLEHFAEDGAVWMVDMREVGHYLPKVFVDELKNTRSFSLAAETLSRLVPSLDDLERWESPGTDGFVFFFEPPSIDDRIINQYGLFSVTSRPGAALEPWLASRPGLWKKVIVSAAAKWEIRDKLDQLNSNERVFFPGLDGLSKWLNRSYLKR